MVRTPKNYQGTLVTTRHLGSILPGLLEKVSENFSERPDLILAAWPEIIGAQMAKMARAQAFREGILEVKVSNSSLYSLLAQHEKQRLLEALRHRFPKVAIRAIQFRMG